MCPDSSLRVRPGLEEKAATVWTTASRGHLNRDFTFGSQALAVAFTLREAIGGRVWPNVIFEDGRFDFAFTIWGNSTLVLQRQFREGCPGMHGVRRGASHGSGWPARYYPAYPPATAAVQRARTVPGAASPAPPGTPAAGLSGASFPPQACCRLRRKAPPSRHMATW